jgi:hypothetical protein
MKQKMTSINMKRFRKLLEKEKILEKSGKSFLEENPENYQELISYRVAIRDQYWFQNRFKYFSLMKDFLENKISEPKFVKIFNVLYYYQDALKIKNMEQDLEPLETFWINAKSRGFSELITQISQLCRQVDPELYDLDHLDEDENDNHEIDISDVFQKEIQEIYLVLKNFQTP